MLVALLIACSGEVTINNTQTGCTDYDYDNPAPSTVVVDVADDVATVRRTNIALDSGSLAFVPDVVAEGDRIDVFEAWQGEGDGLPFCYDAVITIEPAPRAEVRWYQSADEAVPFATVEIEPG